ncbi:hypothetical protein HMPREF3101_09940 [Corynebacterium sp. HMSC29G08]|nr:hypothetical protein HMPREF3101_09940 [Corynebacterium sp. HMSC29G08]
MESKPVYSLPRFDLIMTDLAGAPREIVDVDTGQVVGKASQTLYGTRTWQGHTQCPLLHAGQYLDAESGWAYNRYRYYHPHAGIYNAQDPLGVSPRVASAQGYVDHPAHWVDFFGLSGKGGHVNKATQIAENRVQGSKGEDKVRAIIEAATGVAFDDQMTVQAIVVTENVTKTVTSRIDFIVKQGENFLFIEVKTGNATLTKNQAVVRDVVNGTGTKTEPGAVELRARDSKARKIGMEQGDMLEGRFHQIYADNPNDIKTLKKLLNIPD